ncbi:MAG: helix-turn-helix domain-containing protein [Cyanobacteria bacterium SBC]|nr:helix-turn-helix domain-containing protein [Cyanobacteria bacterium SBC]
MNNHSTNDRNHSEQDVFEFLDSLTPDDRESQLTERQEAFRIALTQAMRDMRKRIGLTQKEVANRLGVTQSWVSKLESANHDHTFESVLAYLSAIGADFEAILLLDDRYTKRVRAGLNLSSEEIDRLIQCIFGEDSEKAPDPQNSSGLAGSTDDKATEEIENPDFNLSESDKEKCQRANQVHLAHGFWGQTEAA